LFTKKNLTVNKDEKILITGVSGSGKTTLFKILLGFEEPDRGDVTFNGLSLNAQNISKIRKDIFYLSQDIDLRNDKVSQILNETFEFNMNKPIDPDQLDRIFKLLVLTKEILDQNITDLSGGERQRVGLALCFLLDRPVWLLDEPTSALDNKTRKKIADFILSQNKTILIISHDGIWKSNPEIRIERLI
jgi:putative ABC transport system ATP-binding protein